MVVHMLGVLEKRGAEGWCLVLGLKATSLLPCNEVGSVGWGCLHYEKSAREDHKTLIPRVLISSRAVNLLFDLRWDRMPLSLNSKMWYLAVKMLVSHAWFQRLNALLCLSATRRILFLWWSGKQGSLINLNLCTSMFQEQESTHLQIKP